jgi:hypothetical protein
MTRQADRRIVDPLFVLVIVLLDLFFTGFFLACHPIHLFQ